MKFPFSRFLVPIHRGSSPCGIFPSSRFLVFLLSWQSLLITTTAFAQVVDIPDPNLRGCYHRGIGICLPTRPITQQEMLRLTELLAWQRDLANITGLQHATNLSNLHLTGTGIQDVTPLANLTKLTELDLAYNAIQSVEPLSGLTDIYTD